ncbi:MAG TPA: MFS transporter [Candidatus Acidoferrum sp.]|jgi:predicted MFS family arabinose efflux permease|nr:MFS transporter [Candidatus Acidoferrum sp.]
MTQMTETIHKSLRDSKTARWTALLIVSFTMLCGYYVADVMSPLKPMIEQQLGWTSSEYGFFTGAYAWFNVFLGVLIFGGMVLDKMGARFTGIASSILMVLGCGIKWWAVQTHTLDNSTVHLLFWDFKSQVLLASVGFAIFGAGIEIVNVVATKIIARWFLGYEIALAMGLQVGTARLGTALALGMGAPIATYFKSVAAPVLVGVILLSVGLVAYILYCAMDKKLDASETDTALSDEEAFHISDIGKILRIRGFWYITMLCALFYSAVFPFLKYAPDLMVQKFQVKESLAGAIPSILPFATIPLTVVFGRYYDRKGKGATLMILGSVLLVLVHFIFAVPFLNSWLVALAATIVLGFAFSLVPSAMWPSLPKFIPQHQLGTAYALIFWMQNLVALWGIPYLIGWILDRYCIVGTRVADGLTSPAYNYTLPMVVFTALGVLAVIFGFLLKMENKKMNYGLELPCQKA